MKTSKAFTLIELLVVIGLLGILATGLLAAVDPFEQLKKGRDTNLRNVVVEYYNASIRYYATHGELPWCDGTDCSAGPGTTPTALSSLTTYTDLLVGDGELKEDFETALGGNADKVYVTSPDEVSIYACFRPESKSLRGDDSTRYDQDGALNTADCGPSVDADTKRANECYWCAK